jgi:hypothetical protein
MERGIVRGPCAPDAGTLSPGDGRILEPGNSKRFAAKEVFVRTFPLVSLVAVLAALARPSAADTLIIDSSDTTDWVRLLADYAWKNQDTILRPVALLKTKLNDIPAGAVVTKAELHFYVERTQLGGTVSVNYVKDDAWSFLLKTPSELYNWPIDHTIASYGTGLIGWRKFDVTAEVLQNLSASDRVLSIKIGDITSDYQEQIAGPASPAFDRRPFLKIDFNPSLVVTPPDLTLGGSEIRPSDPTPTSGQIQQIVAKIYNYGPRTASNVPVRLYDGDPKSGGIAIGAQQTIASIPPAGGTGTASFPWSASPGLHALFVVADPGGVIPEIDETNNQAFAEVAVQKSYDSYFEGVESQQIADAGTVVWQGLQAGLGRWSTDADVPFDPNIGLCRQWQIASTRTEAYEGDASLFLYLDGRSDDGTIWVERWFPVDPNTTVQVDLSFAFGKGLDAATSPVYAIGLSDPEVEEDFTRLTLGNGWQVHNVHQAVATGSSNRIWVAVGLTVTWETEVFHYLDSISVSLH